VQVRHTISVPDRAPRTVEFTEGTPSMRDAVAVDEVAQRSSVSA